MEGICAFIVTQFLHTVNKDGGNLCNVGNAI